jgi:hypothetical protein
MDIKQWDIWYAEWAHFDTPEESKDRTVLITSMKNSDLLKIAVIKITTKTNYYDEKEYIDILEWEKAGLREPSYIVLTETRSIPIQMFKKRLEN